MLYVHTYKEELVFLLLIFILSFHDVGYVLTYVGRYHGYVGR